MFVVFIYLFIYLFIESWLLSIRMKTDLSI